MHKPTVITQQPKNLDFNFDDALLQIQPTKLEPPHVFKRLLLSEMVKSHKTKKKLVAGIGTNDAHYRVSYKEDGRTYNCPYYDKWKYLITNYFTPNGLVAGRLYKGYKVNAALLNFSIYLQWYEAIEQAEGIKPEPYETIDIVQAQDILEQSKAVESEGTTLRDIYGTSITKDLLANMDEGLSPEQEAEIDKLEADYGYRYSKEDYLEMKAGEAMLQNMAQDTE